jgi:hypothetical protein
MAARVFGADWTFYVLAGSSASNRIVIQASVGQDEMVVVDRNCHKSLNHAMTLARSRPVYFQPSRNGYGMIGLIPPSRFTAAHIAGLVKDSPLSKGARSTDAVHAVVTNPTYDGILYNVDRVATLLADTSTKPGTRTASSILCTATASRWACRATCRSGPRSSACSRPTRCCRPSRWPPTSMSATANAARSRGLR